MSKRRHRQHDRALLCLSINNLTITRAGVSNFNFREEITMARSPVTEVVKGYNALTEVEQKVFLDLVDPQPEPEVVVKTRKKRTTKSAKAQSLSSAISRAPKPQRGTDEAEPPKADINSNARCTAQVPTLDVPCGELETNRIHDQTAGYASYHPFASSVPSATRRSSRKGSGTGSEVNSETSKGAAADASGD